MNKIILKLLTTILILTGYSSLKAQVDICTSVNGSELTFTYTAQTNYNTNPFYKWNSQTITLRYPATVNLTWGSITDIAAFEWQEENLTPGPGANGGDGYIYKTFISINPTDQSLTAGIPVDVFKVEFNTSDVVTFQLIGGTAFTTANNLDPSLNNAILAEVFGQHYTSCGSQVYNPSNDADGDLVPDDQEAIDGTSANNAMSYKDTDGDLVPDYIESLNGTNPNDATDFADADGDLVPDYVEVTRQPNSGAAATNPSDASSFMDTDAGGVPDYVETIYFVKAGLPATNPAMAADDNRNSDGDTLSDYAELLQGSDPLDACDPVPCNQSTLLNVKMFLQGAYESSTSLMRDDLRSKGYLPLTQPYSALSKFNYHTGTESILSSVLNVTGNKAIVDWVLVELRSSIDPTEVIASQAALLTKDGSVVGLDGVSPLSFMVTYDDYYVAVSHRNHLSTMIANPVQFSGSTVTVDFTAQPGYGSNAQVNINGKNALWAGNASMDSRVIFQGGSNDVDFVKQAILTDQTNTSFDFSFIRTGYQGADTNLDGEVRYQGPANDVDKLIFFNVLSHPANTGSLTIFIINEQMP